MAEHVQRQRSVRYMQDVYGPEAEHLWARYPGYAVFRHPASRKWYAAVMDLPMDKLGLTGTERIDVLNVKCSPMIIGSLLAGEGFLPAYHMNKGAWISILLDGTVPDGQIEPLLDWSYESAATKSRRRSLPDAKST